MSVSYKSSHFITYAEHERLPLEGKLSPQATDEVEKRYAAASGR